VRTTAGADLFKKKKPTKQKDHPETGKEIKIGETVNVHLDRKSARHQGATTRGGELCIKVN